MKTNTTTFFVIILFLLSLVTVLAAPDPPPPNGKNQGPPPPVGLPIDENCFALLILGLIFGAYTIYKHNQKCAKVL